MAVTTRRHSLLPPLYKCCVFFSDCISPRLVPLRIVSAHIAQTHSCFNKQCSNKINLKSKRCRTVEMIDRNLFIYDLNEMLILNTFYLRSSISTLLFRVLFTKCFIVFASTSILKYTLVRFETNSVAKRSATKY